MRISDAISKKLNKICKERNISVNKLANMSLLTQSTVEHLINGDSKNPKLLTIIRICDGLEMSLQEFFADDLFRNMDRED